MTTTAGELDQYLDLKTVSARTRVPYSTLRQWVAQGKLPAYHIRHHIRVRVADVEALVVPIEPKHHVKEGD
jgi:excisionase family DNA binding protein